MSEVGTIYLYPDKSAVIVVTDQVSQGTVENIREAWDRWKAQGAGVAVVMPGFDVAPIVARPPEGTRLVLMTEELAAALGVSRVEWGEPDEHGWYVPTLYDDPGHDPAADGADEGGDS